MTSEEFLSELDHYEGATSDIEGVYHNFQVYQELAFNTLIEFDRICRQANIKYLLAYGSLLGAIRDFDQIPWDYDIDVFVPYSQRKELIEALDKYLAPTYYYCSVENDEDCTHLGLTRIAPCGFNTKYLHVDVFYLASQTQEEELALKENVKTLCIKYRGKVSPISDLKRLSKRERLMVGTSKLKTLFVKKQSIRKQYEDALLSTINNKGNYFEADRFALDYSFPSYIFENTIDVVVRDYRFKAPACYDEILKKLYGDYHKIPPLKQRYDEMMRHYTFLINHCPLE